MLEQFRKLLRPMPTVVFNPYAWKQDDRTTSEKIRSGLRLAGSFVVGILILVLCGVATRIWPHDPTGRFAPIISGIVMSLAVSVLFLTVHRWAQVVSGFLVVGVVRLAFGTVASVGNSDSFNQLGEALLIICPVIALLWRFLGRHPAPITLLDRVALTYAVLSSMKEVTRLRHNPPIFLIYGIAALAIAWTAYRWNKFLTKSTHDSNQREQSSV